MQRRGESEQPVKGRRHRAMRPKVRKAPTDADLQEQLDLRTRSRVHRQAKNAEVPWEDEKFSYVAVSRRPASTIGARVIARPRKASGRVTLKLCRPDGSAGDQLFSRRDGALFKRASRADWGSSM